MPLSKQIKAQLLALGWMITQEGGEEEESTRILTSALVEGIIGVNILLGDEFDPANSTQVHLAAGDEKTLLGSRLYNDYKSICLSVKFVKITGFLIKFPDKRFLVSESGITYQYLS
jgi:hypothetical protein